MDGIRNLFSKFFGTISWNPPSWIIIIFDSIISCSLLLAINSLRLMAEKPVRFCIYCLLSFSLIISTLAGYQYYINMPAPELVGLSYNKLSPQTIGSADSKPSKLNIFFSAPAAELKLIGKIVNEGVELNPKLSGEWKWQNDRNLSFEPKTEWTVGQKYSVKFDNTLFSSKVRLEKKYFEFDAPALEVMKQSSEFYQDPSDPKIRQAVLKLRLSHLVDKTDLERKTSIRIKRKSQKDYDNSASSKLGFKLAFDDKLGEAYVRSDIISIPEHDSQIQIKIEKGLKAAAGGSGMLTDITETVDVPGVENYFKISDISESIITNKDTHEAERIISISTTASIKQQELIKNLSIELLPDDPELYKQSIEVSYSDEYEQDNEDIATDSCPWTDPAQIPQAAFLRSIPVKFEWLENQQDPGKQNSIKIKAEAGRCLLITVKKGTKSFADIELPAERNFIVRTKDFPKEILYTDKGAILALNGERKISVLSRGIKNIKFRLYRVLPNALHHLSQFGFNYPYTFSTPSFDYNFGPENISEVFESVSEIANYQPGKTSYSLFDFGKYLDTYPQNQRGLFILRANSFDPETKTYTGPQVDRLVLVSNLGFIIKQNQDKTSNLYVISSVSQQPVEAANVEVLGKNGLPIFSSQSDANGQVSIPNLSEYSNEKTPVTFVVSSGVDQSFMPYSLNDRLINYSRFDIGGLYSIEDEKSLQAYLFSDRGIYRPSETAKIGLILKKLDWSNLPKDLPLEISVRDPREIEILRQKITFDIDGLTEFTFPVSENALTGGYSVYLEIIGKNKQGTILGQTNIRVEEFLPDRLKIDANWSDSKGNRLKKAGWFKPEDIKADISLKNLYGSPAEGHKIKAEIKLRPNSLYFNEFKNYNFYDPFNPYRKNSAFDESLGEVLTNNQGQSSFDLNLKRFEDATYGLSAVFQGFEKDAGRSVATSLSATISPADYIIGWKADSDLNFLKKGFRPKVNIIAINQDLQNTEVNDLTLELYETKYISVLTRQSSGNLEYQSVLKETLIESKNISIAANGLELQINPEKAGDFIYRIKSKKKNSNELIELNSIRYKAVGDADLSSNLEKNAELDVKLDREDYPSESEIQISISAAYKGAGLITIERDKVYASKWFKSESSSSLQTIKIPKGLEGNAYINIALVRSLDSKDIHASPLSYVAVPFSISKNSRRQPLTLDAPEQMKPGSDLIIRASSASKTKAIIFAVDEGILQVARFKKPDPIPHFFRKRALEVSSKQILDLLIPEYSLTKEVSAPGGDEDALLGKHRNPFKRKGQKPVIFWSGIVELDSNPKDFRFPIPDYFSGSVKSFAVSVSEDKIGSIDSSTLIKSDIVLSPNAPLFASPEDEFTTSVNVTNTTDKDQKVTVALKTDPGLELLSAASKVIELKAGKDQLVEFQLKAMNKLGSNNLIFYAETDNKFSYTIDMSVRPASPKLSSVQIGMIKSGNSSKEIELKRVLFEEDSEKKVFFSSLPLSLSYALSKYLEFYPHSCSEQISSQGLSLLMLSDFSILDTDSRQRAERLQKILSNLSSRQNEDGSFAVWPSSGYSEDWVNMQAARLIIEARIKGISINSYLLSNTERYLKDFSSKLIDKSDFNNSAKLKAYAIYLLTRLGNITTNSLQSLSEQLAQEKNWKSEITAIFMAASYKLLLLEKQANQLLSGFDFSRLNNTKENITSPIFRELSINGLVLDLVSRHFSDSSQARNFNSAYFEKLSEKLSADLFNSTEAANLIMGLSSYSKNLPLTAESNIKLEVSSDSKNFKAVDVPINIKSSLKLPTDTQKIKLSKDSSYSLFYQIFESGFDLPNSAIPKNNGLEIYREFQDQKGKASSEFKLGDDINVVLRIRSTNQQTTFQNIAVIDIHPSGFEANGGLQNMGISYSNWSSDFADATEDRAIFYGDLANGAAEIKYKLKAVAKGKFVLPAAQAEELYDPRIFARTDKSSITIK